MRPYLAIIKDSFREAFHSYVLWIVIALITIFLLALALLSYRQTLTVGLRGNEIDWPALIEQLEKAKAGKGTSGAQRIWSLMNSTAQDNIAKFKPILPGSTLDEQQIHREVTQSIVKDLQSILNKEDLYQSTSFSASSVSTEGKALLQREKALAKDERLRLNRLLLEAAFPNAIGESEATSLVLCLAGYDLTEDAWPVSKQMLVDIVRGWLPFLVDKGLLGIGLLVAIIVTSPAIPNMFDPGSLHLLLSKPVLRSLMFLSKFLGSCAFVLMCATYLFIGIYFLLGTRWGVWEPRLMWCIPVYTFVFGIYYSVAAVAALVWRNMIVSIIVAIVFWALCFSVGLSKEWIEGSLNKARLRRVVPANDGLLAVDCTNTPLIWNQEKRKWVPGLLSRELRNLRPIISVVAQMPVRGPIYDEQGKQAVVVQVSMKSGQQLIGSGKADAGFSYKEGPVSPSSSMLLFNEPTGEPMLATSQGLYRLQGDLASTADEVKFFGYKIPFPSRGPLHEVGPTPMQNWDTPFSAAFGPDGTLFVYSRGKLQRLTKTSEGKYELDKTEKFEPKAERRGWIAATKSTLYLSHLDGKLQLRDPQTLELRSTLEPAPGQCPRILSASPDGKTLAILMENRKLWLLADGEEKLKLAPVRGQGDISSSQFLADNKFLVTDLFQRVSEYDTQTWERKQTWAPRLDVQTMIYLYVLKPVYTVCPKPGELYRTVTYLLTEQKKPEDNKALETPDSERHEYEPEPKISPWRPVYSSLAFMCVMLLIGCVYMERQEF
ncbi:ABC transporter permease [Anatilimnocola floriformis]|uniref:ABC transporter permease n=1 Tax=Anatilimnocola floriformis TaxID=2948575 RepID=UPI0020C28DF7|nr:ABC transporter permease [Anatilimnocola floriformis]